MSEPNPALDDEVLALTSIYPGSLTPFTSNLPSVSTYILTPPDIEPAPSIQLIFPHTYPEEPPVVGACHGMEKGLVEDLLLGGGAWRLGEVCVFELCEMIRELLQNDTGADDIAQPADPTPTTNEAPEGVQLEWAITEPITDRKSVFIGHATQVHTQQEAKTALADLLHDKKIARATHNMVAWRIVTESGSVIQDNDDDGETAAGSRMAHLLELTSVQNVIVVVSRWYGGIHLGADRFKHINAAAREALRIGGFLPEEKMRKEEKGKGGGKKGKR
ncbi:UPF0029-domain-containing protein [Saitoella complicata NRRL Y-17804]|uniref:RWD domain-containing protein n=1 Tax=Saitoella complicata (strain BCRC 22490 / CBS 7301 / JCM 7358 / NBRC 10748 / NRRL Y-17804) TaxID=698492 RepID=A0A0E9N873_SAICN|nr:UPF0029-domain-containing protein [Saitoella complicata NRRL Y-17804]ODQ55614.1 UPF0029-domain-containing protein [Saitoella complicata NRRL Y-17804]GAO46029.1 hypothetical protein G7K_0274-t1 [Saitoella complicata NRRL Y-17804]